MQKNGDSPPPRRKLNIINEKPICKKKVSMDGYVEEVIKIFEIKENISEEHLVE